MSGRGRSLLLRGPPRHGSRGWKRVWRVPPGSARSGCRAPASLSPSVSLGRTENGIVPVWCPSQADRRPPDGRHCRRDWLQGCSPWSSARLSSHPTPDSPVNPPGRQEPTANRRLATAPLRWPSGESHSPMPQHVAGRSCLHPDPEDMKLFSSWLHPQYLEQHRAQPVNMCWVNGWMETVGPSLGPGAARPGQPALSRGPVSAPPAGLRVLPSLQAAPAGQVLLSPDIQIPSSRSHPPPSHSKERKVSQDQRGPVGRGHARSGEECAGLEVQRPLGEGQVPVCRAGTHGTLWLWGGAMGALGDRTACWTRGSPAQRARYRWPQGPGTFPQTQPAAAAPRASRGLSPAACGACQAGGQGGPDETLPAPSPPLALPRAGPAAPCASLTLSPLTLEV